MKFSRMQVFGALLFLALLLAFQAWWHWGELRFYLQLRALTVDNQNRPVFEDNYPEGIQVNSYTDDLPSESIGRCYSMACQRLEAIRGSQARNTYSWEDDLGWPRVSSVVQFASGYTEVTAYQGNDSDGVSVTISLGIFSAVGRSKLQLLSRDHLPSGTLRHQ